MTKNQRRLKKFIIKVISKIVDIVHWLWIKVTPRRKVYFEDMNRETRRKRITIIRKKHW